MHKQALLQFAKIIDPNVDENDVQKMDNWMRRYAVLRGIKVHEVDVKDIEKNASIDVFVKELLVNNKLFREYLYFQIAQKP